MRKILSRTRRAVDDYHMIAEGDKIAVGVSGGKDSLTLLCALAELRRFYPNKFDILALSIDMGFDGTDFSKVQELCEKIGVEYIIEKTDIAEVVFDIRKESNPCSLCAKMRKGALNQKALEIGCNKIAYAHHRDDLIETALMSLIYEGRFHAFSPRTHLDRTGLSVIRPMLYVSEADVKGFRNRYQLPVCKNPCPMDGHTRREYVKNLIRTLDRENPGVKDRLFSAVINGHLEGWPDMIV